MIGRFFSWLGQIFSSFITWLGNLVSSIWQALVDSIQAIFNWFATLFRTAATELINLGLGFVPGADEQTRSVLSSNMQQGLDFIQSCWSVGNAFVPLTEAFGLVASYVALYLAIKIIALIIRIVLAITP